MAPKGVIFAKCLSQNTPIISKLYASASVHQWIIYGSLWGPPGHDSIAILYLDTLQEVLCDKFGQNWRTFSQFKLIVGHIN